MSEQEPIFTEPFHKVLEALIFASDEPLSEKTINELLSESEYQEHANGESIRVAIETIKEAIIASCIGDFIYRCL